MINSKKFTRTKEDFHCEKCGFFVQGNGYTNHCPNCLWSKHVDVNPGDRQESCQSLMQPIGIKIKDGNHIIIHECTKCHFKRLNKINEDDNFEAVIALSTKPSFD